MRDQLGYAPLTPHPPIAARGCGSPDQWEGGEERRGRGAGRWKRRSCAWGSWAPGGWREASSGGCCGQVWGGTGPWITATEPGARGYLWESPRSAVLPCRAVWDGAMPHLRCPCPHRAVWGHGDKAVAFEMSLSRRAKWGQLCPTPASVTLSYRSVQGHEDRAVFSGMALSHKAIWGHGDASVQLQCPYPRDHGGDNSVHFKMSLSHRSVQGHGDKSSTFGMSCPCPIAQHGDMGTVVSSATSGVLPL